MQEAALSMKRGFSNLVISMRFPVVLSFATNGIDAPSIYKIRYNFVIIHSVVFVNIQINKGKEPLRRF
jgi:hypothetical protein